MLHDRKLGGSCSSDRLQVCSSSQVGAQVVCPRPGRQARPITRGARNQLGLRVAMLCESSRRIGDIELLARRTWDLACLHLPGQEVRPRRQAISGCRLWQGELDYDCLSVWFILSPPCT